MGSFEFWDVELWDAPEDFHGIYYPFTLRQVKTHPFFKIVWSAIQEAAKCSQNQGISSLALLENYSLISLLTIAPRSLQRFSKTSTPQTKVTRDDAKLRI
ncbi:hypothetical protein [Phormidesmis priestleyi]